MLSRGPLCLLLIGMVGCDEGPPPPCPEFVGALVTGVPSPGTAPEEPRPMPGARALPMPPRGEYFRDPVFGTCIARVTDAPLDVTGFDPSRERGVVFGLSAEAIRADGQEVLVHYDRFEIHRYDVATFTHLGLVLIFPRFSGRFDYAASAAT